MSEPYDSTVDTNDHIARVQQLLRQFAGILEERAIVHDRSKLVSPEKEVFDVVTPKLKALTYGSEEYKASLAEMGEALNHHYLVNSHHPQHYPNGIDGMNLFDLVEMFLDWKAATERHADGNIWTSIETNKDRFGISDQLAGILRNTAVGLRWQGWDKEN